MDFSPLEVCAQRRALTTVLSGTGAPQYSFVAGRRLPEKRSIAGMSAYGT